MRDAMQGVGFIVTGARGFGMNMGRKIDQIRRCGSSSVKITGKIIQFNLADGFAHELCADGLGMSLAKLLPKCSPKAC